MVSDRETKNFLMVRVYSLSFASFCSQSMSLSLALSKCIYNNGNRNMSSSLVWHFADEKATFARGRVLGHTGLPLYKSSFVAAYSPIFWECIGKTCEMENPVHIIPFKSNFCNYRFIPVYNFNDVWEDEVGYKNGLTCSSGQRSDISILENLKWILDVAVVTDTK